jgi:hypothetical protein
MQKHIEDSVSGLDSAELRNEGQMEQYLKDIPFATDADKENFHGQAIAIVGDMEANARRYDWLEANGYITQLDMDSQSIDEQIQIDDLFEAL